MALYGQNRVQFVLLGQEQVTRNFAQLSAKLQTEIASAACKAACVPLFNEALARMRRKTGAKASALKIRKLPRGQGHCVRLSRKGTPYAVFDDLGHLAGPRRPRPRKVEMLPGIKATIGAAPETRRKVAGNKALRGAFQARHYDALEAARATLRDRINLETQLLNTRPPANLSP